MVGAGEFDEQILDAALERILSTGLREAGVAPIARAAGVAESDVLARFPALEDLIDAVLFREMQRILAEGTAISVTTRGIDAQIEEVSLHILWRIRSHPLVTQLLEVHPDETVGYCTVRGGGLVALGRCYLVSIIEHAQTAGLIEPYDPRPAAEMLVRLAHSLLLVPDGGTDFRDGGRVRGFVLDTIVPMVKYGLPTVEMDHAGDRGE